MYLCLCVRDRIESVFMREKEREGKSEREEVCL